MGNPRREADSIARKRASRNSHVHTRETIEPYGQTHETLSQISHDVHESEWQLLTRLRAARRAGRTEPTPIVGSLPSLTLGQRVADKVAATMGSWTFIILQSIILLAWIILNVAAYSEHWDPYPFILLNLALS